MTVMATKPSQQGNADHGVERETEPLGGGGEQRRGEPPRSGTAGIGTEHARQRPRRARNERIGMSCHAMAPPRPGRPSLDATNCASGTRAMTTFQEAADQQAGDQERPDHAVTDLCASEPGGRTSGRRRFRVKAASLLRAGRGGEGVPFESTLTPSPVPQIL